MNGTDNAYLNLLKKTLTFQLWPEPPLPATTFLNSKKKTRHKIIFNKLLESFFLKFNRLLLKPVISNKVDKLEGKAWSGYAHTMIGEKRLDNIQYAIKTIIKEGVPGDVIEAGVWRGGGTIFMKACLDQYEAGARKVFVADSFKGLPQPSPLFPKDKGDVHYSYNFLKVPLEEVQSNFRQYGVMDENVVFVEGFFNESLPEAPIESLSLLRADGDMYSSTKEILDNLYPKLNPGGFCIIDDYSFPACKSAVNDYRTENNILDEVINVDWSCAYWRKSEE